MACRNEEKARQARDKLESELDRCSLELLRPRPGRPGVGAPRRRDHALGACPARPPGQQRRRDGHPVPADGGRVRAADGAPTTSATSRSPACCSTGSSPPSARASSPSARIMHRVGRLRPDDVGRRRAPQHVGELRHVEAGQPPLHRRAQPAPRRGGSPDPRRGRAPRLDAQQPRRQRCRARRRAGSGAGWAGPPGRRSGSPRRRAPCLSCAPPPRRPSRSGQYIGPAHLFGLFGPPRVAQPSRRARDAAAAAELWRASEELTGVRYSVDAPV